MQLEHQFTVPAPPEVVWAAVVDPARVAPCMPGATLTEVNGSEFTGSVKVKLGPVSLLYKGSGQFVEIDEQSKRVVIKASGKDSRGNGTASATVTVTLKADGANTHGTVATDLAITGKPAQFGRGMISEVGGKILDTFAGALAAQLGVEAPAESAPKPAPRKRTTRTRTTAAAKPAEPAATEPEAPKSEAPKSDTETPKAEAPKPAPRAAAAAKPTPTVKAEVKPVAEAAAKQSRPVAAVPATNGAPVTVRADEPKSAPPKLHVVEEPQVEPIDLLDYAGPSVLKRVLPLVAGLVVLFLLIRWLRKR
ncbi:MAG TPA: SRPBCC family protein [Pseudonocardiaceae bacterium]|nr:SRPBCC family protein [Pseudonocardiaceae bacterium]